MSATKVIKAEARDRVGKGAARALRRQDRVPAVIYGGKKPPLGISLNGNDMYVLLHGGAFMTSIFEVDVDGKKERVIPRDYQLDPVKDFLIHIDFVRVTKDSIVNVDVPVHFFNEAKAPGLKQGGGVLNIINHSIAMHVPADKIPDAIKIDLTDREIGDTIHISEAGLPEEAKLVEKGDFAIATIVAPTVMVEEELTEAAAEEAEAPAEEDKSE
jgi:large subunit ribosomal protein L25